MTTPSAEIVEEELRELYHERPVFEIGESGILQKTERTTTTFKDPLIGFVAGTFGGIASVYVGQPLDTVKVKMQTFPHLHSRMISCLKDTFRKDGIARGLYAGTLPAVAANVAENSVLFAAYGTLQKLAVNLTGVPSVKELPNLASAICGSAAAFFCSFTLCPTELIKCKLQALRETGAMNSCIVSGKSIPWTPFALTRHIMRTGGFRGMFCGLSSTMAREMGGYFFFFGGYEFTRGMLTPEGKSKDDIGILRTIVAGGVGGMTLWTVVFPFDVVKSRVQIQSSNEGLLQVMRHIYKTEGGIRPFYNGLAPSLVRTFPATGVLFVVYEWSKKFLHNMFD